ncbi:hypothetical protein L9F63_013235, partial [Diploptera punctata]
NNMANVRRISSLSIQFQQLFTIHFPALVRFQCFCSFRAQISGMPERILKTTTKQIQSIVITLKEYQESSGCSHRMYIKY